jgi:enoyl-CoA hydratase/carnithine racemase
MSFDGETMRVTRDGDVLDVELCRAPCNEIGTKTIADLERLVDVAAKSGARAMVLRSSVERGFSAGADLGELLAGIDEATSRGGDWPAAVRSHIARIHAAFDALDMLPMTTVAAVHGVVFGGGFELALTCDVIVADASARFAFPELRLGLVPGFGGLPRLARDVGNAVVRDLLFTGRSLGSQRAQQLGLCAHLVAKGEAAAAARSIAAQAARFDPKVVARAKDFAKPIPRDALRRERELFCEMVTSSVVIDALRRHATRTDALPYLP